MTTRRAAPDPSVAAHPSDDLGTSRDTSPRYAQGGC